MRFDAAWLAVVGLAEPRLGQSGARYATQAPLHRRGVAWPAHRKSRPASDVARATLFVWMWKACAP